MAKGCKKCDPHEICEECPEWIFTLADLIMCMMGLFVLLWVLKPSPTPPAVGSSPADIKSQEDRQNEVIGSIREGLGYVPDPQSSDPVDQAMTKKAMRLVGPGEQGTKKIKEDGAEGTDPEVQNIRPSNIAAVGTRISFDPGKTALQPEDITALNDILPEIRGKYLIVMIKGHAARDDFEEGTSPERFMDISVQRAKIVGDYLVANGCKPDAIRIQGCSIYEPLKERAFTTAAQRANRRVEVEVTNITVRDLQDPNKVSSNPVE